MSKPSLEGEDFSEDLLQFIKKWQDKPGNLIMVLHRVQEEFGYLPRLAIEKVSALLGVPLAKIYGVITFYHFFKLTRPGKYNLQICMGTACYLAGAGELISECERLLGIGINQVTSDGLFSLEAVRCVGCCGLAPVVMVGEEVFGKVTRKELPGIMKTLKERP